MDNQLNCLTIGWQKKVLRSKRFLKEMNAAEPWKRLVVLIESRHADGRLERKLHPLELMLRIYCHRRGREAFAGAFWTGPNKGIPLQA